MITEWTGCYQDSWKGVITDAAFAHPAKFSKGLVERILDYMAEMEWIKKGDVIGDPFGGVGTGGIIAAYHGYQWFGVELERKFFNLANANFEKHESKWAAMHARQPLIMLGDSRIFDKQCAAVLTSPPYVSGGHHTDVMDAGNQNGRGQVSGVVASPPYAGSLDDGGPEKQHPDGYPRSNNWTGYGKSEGQIAALKSGEVDAVVSSPPFGTREDGGGIAQTGENRLGRSIRAIVTSPPYETISAGAGGLNHLPAKAGQQGGRKKGASQSADQQYGDTPGQIAHCQKASVDALVSSPPYEDSMDQKGHGIDFSKAKKDYPGRVNHPERNKRHSDAAAQMQYGETPGHIGQEKGETYWEAMKLVYEACYRSLRPGGVMALVVKDFVKDKQRMPLCDDTMRLLVWLGFEEVERVHAMLTEEQIHGDLFEGTTTKKTERKSFFRRLHESKLAADDPRRINFEEVLFVRKPTRHEKIQETRTPEQI